MGAAAARAAAAAALATAAKGWAAAAKGSAAWGSGGGIRDRGPDVPVEAGSLGRRDVRQVHVHAEAGRGDRVLRRPTFRRPVLARADEAARDDWCTREAAPGDVHVAVDAARAVLHPAAGRSRARAERGAHNRLGGDPADVPVEA
eukprot:scaffold33128_cov72-Phaeocystis_antarctica.AAC.1